MKLIPPIVLVDSMLLSSNVVETATAWNMGTTYASGAQVGVPSGSGNSIDVYESLLNSNTNHPPASSPTWWSKVSITYDAYSSGVSYAKGDRVISISTNSHLVYESAAASNIGNALTDTAKWILVGNTNLWAPFDQKNMSQAIRSKRITYQIKPMEYINTVALMNLVGSSVTLTMTDPSDGVVYNATKSLISDNGIDNWYDWFFTDFDYVDQAMFVELPNYVNATFTITIDGPSDVAVGVISLGYARDIGDEQYGASVGIIDYSYKDKNQFGDYEIIERAYSKSGSFTVFVAAGFVDTLQSMLAKYRAVPIVYYVSPLYASTVIYGFFTDFKVTIEYWNYSVLTITIEGLT